MTDFERAAQLWGCVLALISKVTRPEDGSMVVTLTTGAQHTFPPEQVAASVSFDTIDLSDGVSDAEAALASHALRARMINDDPPAPVKTHKKKG